MTSALLLFGANIIALTAALLAGVTSLLSSPRSRSARLFAAVAFGSACYLLGRLSYAVPPAVQIHFFFWPLLLVFMNVGNGLWMLLAHHLFEEEKPFPRWMVAAFSVQVLLSAINALGYVGRSSSALQSADYPLLVNFLFGPLPIAMQAAFALQALRTAVSGWQGDLDESRRVLRGLFVIVFGGLFFGVSLIELYLVDALLDVRGPADNVLSVVLAVGYLALAIGALRFDHRIIDRLATRSIAPPPEAAVLDRHFTALTRALDQQKVYLKAGLTIADLARHLAMPQYRLRALINQRLGYRNFNALLHDYRLRDIRSQLADPARANIPILTIALEAGYQSITPFNQAFRETMGCTPSEWRRQHCGAA